MFPRTPRSPTPPGLRGPGRPGRTPAPGGSSPGKYWENTLKRSKSGRRQAPPGSRAAGPGPGQHEAGSGFGSSSRGAAVTQNGQSEPSSGEPEKRGRDPPAAPSPSPRPFLSPSPPPPGPEDVAEAMARPVPRPAGTGGERKGTPRRSRGVGARPPELRSPFWGHPRPAVSPAGLGGSRHPRCPFSGTSPCLLSGRCEGTVAAAHLGCIREMRRALLTGPRWGEIYVPLSGTEPHKSSPPRTRTRGTVPESRQPPGDALLDGEPGMSERSSWPSVVAACGPWVTEVSQACPGCCGDIGAWPCPPELPVPG